jgi:hypothetical protein
VNVRERKHTGVLVYDSELRARQTGSKGSGSACRQRKVQELVLGGRGKRQATVGAKFGAWWTGV